MYDDDSCIKIYMCKECTASIVFSTQLLTPPAGQSGINGGGIAGGALAGLVIIAAISSVIVVVFWLLRRRNKEKSRSYEIL